MRRHHSFLSLGLVFVIFFVGIVHVSQDAVRVWEEATVENLQGNILALRLKERAYEKFFETQPATLLFVGDIMLDRGVDWYILREGGEDARYPFLKVADVLQKADLAFGNLEGPISDKGTNQGSIYSFRMRPELIEGLVFAGFDVLSIANNHIWDWGRDALRDTVTRLKESNIDPVGAGRNDYEANKPKFFTLRDTRIAIFAYTTLYPDSLEATKDSPGVSDFDIEKISAAISNAKKEADIVAISMHWGEEYETEHNDSQERIARALVDAGADLIIGHHPHVVQEVEQYKNGWIAYSLGNFVFDQSFSKETMEGLVLEIKTQKGEILSVTPHTIKISQTSQPEFADL